MELLMLLAQQKQCSYISDLKFLPKSQLHFPLLKSVDLSTYPESEWIEAVSYIWGYQCSCSEQARQRLITPKISTMQRSKHPFFTLLAHFQKTKEVLAMLSELWNTTSALPPEDHAASQHMLGGPYVEYDSLKALSHAAGFDVTVPAMLPSADAVHFFLISEEVADIRYSSGIVYRMCRSYGFSMDISGDYTHYKHIDIYHLKPYRMIARGSVHLAYSVLWWDDDYSYSIFFPHGVPFTTIKEWILSVSSKDACEGI